MLTTKQFLKQGLQVGPWKITRKVLLFIVAFCFVVLAFGTLMLETHAFDSDWDDDDDNSHERYDDDDDDWELGGGDMVMMVVMGITGLVIMACVLACCFAQINPPGHLDQRAGNEQVFTIQLTKPSIGPQHPESLTHYQLYHQQQYEQQLRQYQQQQAQSSPQQQQQQQRPQHNSSRAHRGSAPSAHAHHARSPPPPYSPPAAGAAPPSVPSNAAHTNEKPPPYSP